MPLQTTKETPIGSVFMLMLSSTAVPVPQTTAITAGQKTVNPREWYRPMPKSASATAARRRSVQANISIPDQEPHGRGVVRVAGIIELRAIGNQRDHIHLRR